ncbi:hypothetical protein EDD17DRAFT_1678010 [Pisolithus thermaeus]|nr:hypothetical protein EDD17DRAFT_1678010 [Pisolithus thermaeus]
MRYANLCVCLTSTMCTVVLIHIVDGPHAVWLGTFNTLISLSRPLLMKDFLEVGGLPTVDAGDCPDTSGLLPSYSASLYWRRIHAVT